MLLSVKTHLVYTTAQPCDVLLQIEPVSDAGQICQGPGFTLISGFSQRMFAGEDGVGTRRWLNVDQRLDCGFEAQVQITRPVLELAPLAETPRVELPAEAIKYLMASRYCPSDLFLDFVAGQFGDLRGGALVQAMRDWIGANFTYDNSVSDAGTTATDSFSSLKGVCRDYAHVLISFVRAAGIPARFVSGFAPDVSPQDFHAVAEVYLAGDWHIVDATGMATPSDVARICVGRDAADASFLTSYGMMDLQEQTVEVTRLQG